MKYFLIILFSTCLGYMFVKSKSYGGLDEVDKFAIKISKELAKKYGLSHSGIGGGATKEGVWLIKTHFLFEGLPISINQGRKIIVPMLEEFLNEINSNKNIHSLLRDYPFTPKNVDIIIFFHDFDNERINDPYLNTVSAHGGEIGYFTQDPDNKYKYKFEMYEPYEEALEKVKQKE